MLGRILRGSEAAILKRCLQTHKFDLCCHIASHQTQICGISWTVTVFKVTGGCWCFWTVLDTLLWFCERWNETTSCQLIIAFPTAWWLFLVNLWIPSGWWRRYEQGSTSTWKSWDVLGISMHIKKKSHIYLSIYLNILLYIHIYICIYVYIYIHIYIHMYNYNLLYVFV